MQDTLASERGAVSVIDQEILQSRRDQETVAQNINLEFEQRITFGERIADRLASVRSSCSGGRSTTSLSSCSIWCCRVSPRCRRR